MLGGYSQVHGKHLLLFLAWQIIYLSLFSLFYRRSTGMLSLESNAMSQAAIYKRMATARDGKQVMLCIFIWW